jgi:CheY-like chemotaxis protein
MITENDCLRPEKNRTKVLILDDEPCISELLGEILQLLGYSATKCSSPCAALDLLDKEHFDVILTDFRMPQMNGDEFYFQATGKYPELARRVVFLTGDTASEDTRCFLDRHQAPSLSKPFDIASVEQVILEVVKQESERAAA